MAKAKAANGTAVLGREGFLAAAAPVVEDFDLPGGRGTVRLRQLSTGDQLALDDDTTGADLIARAAIDADGNRLFGDDERDALLALDAEVVAALVKKIMSMNFRTKDAAEDLAKN